MAGESLASFHPLVREWFLARYGKPTAVQAEAWPLIAAGSHVLALAPTGSGKTLTAFLGAMSRIASGELSAEHLSVLYVSPLKALGEDVRRNLVAPLGELEALFRARGVPWPGIQAATRNGDTSQTERRRMLRKPPSILVTTPESLALMLDSPASRSMLAQVRLLVLDEIHVLAGDKRGALLACSVGRLALLAGEFQRVALSATVRPVGAIADFVGGRQLLRDGGAPASYRRRPVAVVAPPADKRIELAVLWPVAPPGPTPPSADSGAASRYGAIIPEIGRKMESSTGILVFTDSRRRAERMAFLINEARGEGAAWAHHGSLSKEARRVVEERFKERSLGCVVATASLELGIDIGSVEEVLLAGSPPAVASALQRIGRSGHGVGETSRGSLYPFHGMDLVLAAAVYKGVEERAVEETRPLSSPLDVLAQVILELSLEGARSPDALYDIVLSFPPFERLSRSLFDATLDMLAGRYSGTRLRELEPRLAIDAASGMVIAGKSVSSLLYSSGGTIPDRGLFSLRIEGSRTKIGELDEEFVWERQVGEVFTLGAQAWRILEIGSEAVIVAPAPPDPDIVPFWKGEAWFRSPELSSRALALLDRLDGLDEADGAALLQAEYGFDAAAAETCSRFVGAQKAAGLGRPSLPLSGRLVLELHEEGGSHGDSSRLVLHSLRGLAVNEPLSLALAAAMEEACGLAVQRLADDDLILLSVPKAEGLDPGAAFIKALRSLAQADTLDRLLRSCLEGSGIFGAQFRMNAGRALLLPRGLPGRRMPLWMTRLRARRLFEAVRGSSDFPIIVETWRSCLGDLFDLDAVRQLVIAVAEGRVELALFSSRAPSPFAREALWKEVGENMYRTDELQGRASSSVSDRVIAEALRSASLRPRLPASLVADFEERLKRLLPGWAPEDCLSLAEWARERVLIPVVELPLILASAGEGLAEALEREPDCGGRLVRTRLPGASEEVLVHAERLAALVADPGAQLAEWLRREAAVPPSRISALFGLAEPGLGELLEELAEEGTIVLDLLVEAPEGEAAVGLAVIDAQNLDILLRRARAAARPLVTEHSPEDLARLVFGLQGLDGRGQEGGGRAAVEAALAALSGAAAPAGLWESELLPARVRGYRSAELDALMAASPWQWFGAGRARLSFCRPEDLELFLPPRRRGSSSKLLPAGDRGLDFWEIKEKSGLGSSELESALWSEAWKGLIASDSFRDLREGLARRFGADAPKPAPEPAGLGASSVGPAFGARRRIPRALRERWKAGAPTGGRWFALDLFGEEEEGPDALDRAALDAARVRVLAARYGLLCRAMLEREEEGLRWGELFPAMRRLELSGELLAGRFFKALDGPQFLEPSAFPAFAALDSSPARASPVWVNALDPAAMALYAPALRQELLPSRLAANRLCVDAGRILALSSRSYRSLELAVGVGDPRLPAVLALFTTARGRECLPERRIVLETVNGMKAALSPFAEALMALGFEADRSRLVLW